MKEPKFRNLFNLKIPCWLLVLSLSCVSHPTPDTKVFLPGEPSQVALEFSRNGDEFTLWGAALSGQVRGRLQQEEEGYLLGLETFDYFSNWADGWSQMKFLISGEILLKKDRELLSLTIVEAPEILALEAGSVRYGETRLVGEEGWEAQNARYGRLDALAKMILGDLELPGILVYSEPDFLLFEGRSPENLIQFFGPFLFPEVYRPTNLAEYEQGGDYAQGHRWNRAYTEAHFPARLQELRNSGTLYRDWREAGPLLMSLLNWESLWSSEYVIQTN